jgi:16S rRNA (cytosine967-C5)-methyltransferase
VKTDAGIRARKLAIEVLIKLEKEGLYVNSALAQALERTDLSARDKAFVTALVMGVMRQRDLLDTTIANQSSRKLDKMPAILINILRLAIFQLEFMPEIPASAVVDTSCKLASILGHRGLVSFTNGLLRSCLLKMQNGEKKNEITGEETTETIAQKYSMPNWLVERWISRYGLEETTRLLVFAQTPPPLVLRACSLSITSEGLANILANNDIDTKPGLLVSDCLILEGKSKHLHKSIKDFPGFAEGMFSVQDEASAFVVTVLDPKPGDVVIDLCAAPGGKTTYASELMNNTGQVFAIDKSDKRLDNLRENRKRLGLNNIRTLIGDATNLELFDPPNRILPNRILIDAPCMGTGVINRHPDQRYRQAESDLKSLVSLQRALLENAARQLETDGVIVYSTCSIEPEENIENFNWFLENHKNFEPENIFSFLPQKAIDLWRNKNADWLIDMQSEAEKGTIQFLPSRHDTSGFFISRMRKVSE